MTPKEKAIELVAKYKSQSFGITTKFQHFKQCALIAIDFMIEITNKKDDINRCYYFDLNEFDIQYLNEIKTEIQKL